MQQHFQSKQIEALLKNSCKNTHAWTCTNLRKHPISETLSKSTFTYRYSQNKSTNHQEDDRIGKPNNSTSETSYTQ